MAKLVYEQAYDWYRCSACKKIFKRRMVEEDFEQYEFQPKLNFCPNCGSPFKEELVEYMKEMEHAPSYLAKNNVTKNYPYCHCGADMRGENDAID